jgi:hypothetical protein
LGVRLGEPLREASSDEALARAEAGEPPVYEIGNEPSERSMRSAIGLVWRALIVCMMVYVMSNFTPIQRIVDIKDLYEYRETAAMLANDVSFIQEVTAKAEMSESNVEKIMGVTKIIVAVGIIVFMLVYSVKILDSNREYPYALRNKETNTFAKKNLCVRT